jgi:hypothetical protein
MAKNSWAKGKPIAKISFEILQSEYDLLNKSVITLKINSVSELMRKLTSRFIKKQYYLLPKGLCCGNCQNFNKWCYKLVDKESEICRLKINEFKQ